MDKFEIWTDLYPVGQGGMSNVYSARDPEGRKVAIKFLHENFVNDSVNQVKNRFVREASILKNLKTADVNLDDSSIAHILDFDFDHPQPFIVTEFIDGPTLDSSVAQSGPFDLDYAIEIFAELATTISALHEKGIYHRDIKPSNIIICENKPVLIDFSISTFDNATALTQIGSVIGTPQYLSPEAHLQNSSFDTSASSDWWGFSATLCFALTGKPPFGEAAATLSNINAGNIDLQGLGASVRQILSVALDPDIKNRASAWETLDELANNVKKHRFRDRMFIWLNKN